LRSIWPVCAAGATSIGAAAYCERYTAQDPASDPPNATDAVTTRFLAALAGTLLSMLALHAASMFLVVLASSAAPGRDWLEGFGVAGYLLMPSLAAAAVPLFWYRPKPVVTTRIYLVLLPILVACLALCFVSPLLVLVPATLVPVGAFLATRKHCRAA